MQRSVCEELVDTIWRRVLPTLSALLERCAGEALMLHLLRVCYAVKLATSKCCWA